ncbi:MAG: hypothetical protein DWQ08_04100 [Proteobacteria bacterium]|nr:MAG: hypothetical protein DWQ08_04100 [Pseudomonadota bacterium]
MEYRDIVTSANRNIQSRAPVEDTSARDGDSVTTPHIGRNGFNSPPKPDGRTAGFGAGSMLRAAPINRNMTKLIQETKPMHNPLAGKIIVLALGASLLGLAAAVYYPGFDSTPASVSLETWNREFAADQSATSNFDPKPPAATPTRILDSRVAQPAGITFRPTGGTVENLFTVAAANDALETPPREAMSGRPSTPKPDASPEASDKGSRDQLSSQESIADELLEATRNASPELSLGPFTACFDQMRAVACPIVGSIPVLKDIVGRLSLELGISCPTGAASTRS